MSISNLAAAVGTEHQPPPYLQVVGPADVRTEPKASQRAVLSAADASAVPPADKVAHSKSRWGCWGQAWQLLFQQG